MTITRTFKYFRVVGQLWEATGDIDVSIHGNPQDRTFFCPVEKAAECCDDFRKAAFAALDMKRELEAAKAAPPSSKTATRTEA